VCNNFNLLVKRKDFFRMLFRLMMFTYGKSFPLKFWYIWPRSLARIEVRLLSTTTAELKDFFQMKFQLRRFTYVKLAYLKVFVWPESEFALNLFNLLLNLKDFFRKSDRLANFTYGKLAYLKEISILWQNLSIS
jgi:hypothetical protein